MEQDRQPKSEYDRLKTDVIMKLLEMVPVDERPRDETTQWVTPESEMTDPKSLA